MSEGGPRRFSDGFWRFSLRMRSTAPAEDELGSPGDEAEENEAMARRRQSSFGRRSSLLPGPSSTHSSYSEDVAVGRRRQSAYDRRNSFLPGASLTDSADDLASPPGSSAYLTAGRRHDVASMSGKSTDAASDEKMASWIKKMSESENSPPNSPSGSPQPHEDPERRAVPTHQAGTSKGRDRKGQKDGRRHSTKVNEPEIVEVDHAHMSSTGRYQSHGRHDSAFKPITLNDMRHIQETGGCTQVNAAPTSLTKGYSAANRRVSIASEEHKHMSTNISPTMKVMSLPSEERSDILEEEEDEDEAILTIRGAEAPAQRAPPTRKAPTSFSAVAGAKPWQTLPKGSGKLSALQHFARSKAHSDFLAQNMEHISVELPLPMKIALYEEVYPIIQKTVKAYERDLGSRHQLTREAYKRQEDMKRLYEMLANL